MRVANTTEGTERGAVERDEIVGSSCLTTDTEIVSARPGSGATALTGAALSNEAFLCIIGQRVRKRRALLHMTRRSLAANSGVSERYLAQLESGQGNMSISLLRRVAAALDLPLAELVDETDIDIVRDAFIAASAGTS